MKYGTALRSYGNKRMEEIESADIVVGIPCYNNERTIVHVIQMVSHGLFAHYKDMRSVIIVADGGSTDDTREVANEFQLKPWQEKMVFIYRGIPGKGTALRSIFEAARFFSAKVCIVVDSDLRSINSDWVKYLAYPVLEKGYHFVAPIYSRYKYDGTITNNIVYNMTRSLYGKRVRQPIGGDFAFNEQMVHYFAEQDVWETDVARFGIDIWMTTTALTLDLPICQSNLGVKIHDTKDPAESLGPMFRQVLNSLFRLMEKHEREWEKIRGSEEVPVFGLCDLMEPEPIKVDYRRLVKEFRFGFDHFRTLWKEIFSNDAWNGIAEAYKKDFENFNLSVDSWIKILYELAATFHRWPDNRRKLLEITTPLYNARVASFINESKHMNNAEAERLVEEQAQAFEDGKDYLIYIWGNNWKKEKPHFEID